MIVTGYPLLLSSRAQWTVGQGPQQSPSALCPMSCSGQGVCVNPPQYAVSQSNQPTFGCVCNPGYGGDYCEGPMTTVQLSGSGSFDTGTASLSAGKWTYYYVTINTGSLTIGGNTLTFSWNVNQPSLSNLFFIFSPVYTNSLGNLYFMPAASWVLNNSAVVPVREGRVSVGPVP